MEQATRLRELYEKLRAIQAEMCEVQREAALGPVDDAEFLGAHGPVRLSDLFGEQRDLILVHNMGARCPYCTMWADGLTGLVPHLEGRAALAVVSPDAPEQQRALAERRGWPYRMVSSGGEVSGAELQRRLGFVMDGGARMPGYSTFHRDDDGTIRHVASDFFGPGDAYNGAWHMFDRLEGGAGDWAPDIG